MTDYAALQAIHDKIERARHYKDVFGPVDRLQHAYRDLVQVVHPDKAEKGLETLASETFHLLELLYRAAERSAKANTYDVGLDLSWRLAPIANQPHVIRSENWTYLLDPKAFPGEISRTYRARRLEDDQYVLLKIAMQPAANPSLEKEARILQGVNDQVSTYVPKILETFRLSVAGGKQLWVNAFDAKRFDGFFSVSEIARQYPKIDPRDAAWIFRRVISQAILARTLNVVNMAITPDHVLVHPISHHPLHLGWEHAIDRSRGSGVATTFIKKWRGAYPREVFAKMAVDQRTDLFMAAKTCIFLMGNRIESMGIGRSSNLPMRIADTLNHCLEEHPARRPTDAREVLDRLTRAIRAEWGTVYRPLEVHEPASS